MKIAIINDVHVGKPLERDAKVRAASHLAINTLPHLLDHITKLHAPDMIVNLGDLIRSENKKTDLKGYAQSISHFNKVKCPVLHILGNHELKHMSVQDVETIWEKTGFYQKSYGMQELGKAALIWLGMEYKPHNLIKHRLPDEQLTWLKRTLQQLQKPAILFTHCAIDEHDVKGNYFYEGYELKNTHGFFLENCKAIQSILSESEFVQIVVQAHMHYFHAKIIERIPYVTCPAMGDNICGPSMIDNMPEIYSLLTFNSKHLSLKAFSREYCFAGVEFNYKA